jgi:hypothetical protein
MSEDCAVGSIWAVEGIQGALAVVLLGPFAAARGVPEYVVAPLYRGDEPEFRWTHEDVRLEAEETGIGRRYAAIWNARPVLETDLSHQAGILGAEATTALRDVYWASVQERTLRGERLGPVPSSLEDRSKAAEFQRQELRRWRPVSARVMRAAEPTAAPSQRQAIVGLGSVQARVWPENLAIMLKAGELVPFLQADPVTASIDTIVTIGALSESTVINMASVPAGLLPVGATRVVERVNNIVIETGLRADPTMDALGATNADYALAA